MKQTQKALKQTLGQYGKFLDPFLVVAILILFLVPILTVLNLTPGSQPPYSAKLVLGEQDTSKVVVTPLQEELNGISVDSMTVQDDNAYILYVNVDAHEKGLYYNDIMTVDNLTADEKKLQLSSNFEAVPEGTAVSVVVDGVRFVILDTDGTTYPPTLYVMPGDSTTVGIEVQSQENVNFSAGFALDIVVE